MVVLSFSLGSSFLLQPVVWDLALGSSVSYIGSCFLDLYYTVGARTGNLRSNRAGKQYLWLGLTCLYHTDGISWYSSATRAIDSSFFHERFVGWSSIGSRIMGRFILSSRVTPSS